MVCPRPVHRWQQQSPLFDPGYSNYSVPWSESAVLHNLLSVENRLPLCRASYKRIRFKLRHGFQLTNYNTIGNTGAVARLGPVQNAFQSPNLPHLWGFRSFGGIPTRRQRLSSPCTLCLAEARAQAPVYPGVRLRFNRLCVSIGPVFVVTICEGG